MALHRSLKEIKSFDRKEMVGLCKEHIEELEVLNTLGNVILSQVLITEQFNKY